MSRKNPYKPPRRPVIPTALLVVEGETEEAFCRYLKQNFNRHCGLCVTIHNARGRSPDRIIEVARAKCCQASFDRVFIWIDEDQPIALKKTHQTVHSIKAKVWYSSPCCVEGFFLTLLGHNPPSSSDKCKSKFHQIGLSADHKLEHEFYSNLFPLARLAALRANHQLLDDLIKLFSNQL